MQPIQKTQRDYRASKSFPATSNWESTQTTSNLLQDRDKSVSRIYSPLVAQSNHTLVSRSGHNCLFWLHINGGLALWYSRHHKTQLVDSDHTYCWTSLTSPTMSEGVRFYLFYHRFLDGFFDILYFLSFVTINQHDLTQEYTFYRSKCHDTHSAITIKTTKMCLKRAFLYSLPQRQGNLGHRAKEKTALLWSSPASRQLMNN